MALCPPPCLLASGRDNNTIGCRVIVTNYLYCGDQTVSNGTDRAVM